MEGVGLLFHHSKVGRIFLLHLKLLSAFVTLILKRNFGTFYEGKDLSVNVFALGILSMKYRHDILCKGLSPRWLHCFHIVLFSALQTSAENSIN